jgi:2-dehydropantoate 2-reductase
VRFVIYGPGAVGGVVAARLYQHGHEVALIARGAHHDRLASAGLLLRDPSGEQRLPIPAVKHPGEIAWDEGDVVLVAVKSQHSPQVLTQLAAAAPANVPVVCLQNGVRNEPEALRRFENVYGVPVACPCVHLEPGVVEAYSWPVTGILDVGRYPTGADQTAAAVAAAFNASAFHSRAIDDLPRWKWRKLITNLGNAIEAVCGPPAHKGPIATTAAAEGEACLQAARIDAVPGEEDRIRRGDLLQLQPVSGQARPGGSTWQSLSRHTHDVETDYLNGEIVLLGRLHGVATPVNALLQRLANRLALHGDAPGAFSAAEFMAMLEQ